MIIIIIIIAILDITLIINIKHGDKDKITGINTTHNTLSSKTIPITLLAVLKK